MRIGFLCDLHLSENRHTTQYEVLSWATAELASAKPDCIIFAGDATCDGNESAYDTFTSAVAALGIPFLYIPGNSDLRCAASQERIRRKASPCRNDFGDVTVYAVNDCDGTVSSEQLALLEGADARSIVFMHHPPENHEEDARAQLQAWRGRHPETLLAYGHGHEWRIGGCDVSLPALDPDKCIGEAPCIVYYDTETKRFAKAHFTAPVPEDLLAHMGVSCFRPAEQIGFAIEHGLRCIELRPDCFREDQEELQRLVARWRESGGENLSIHLPEVGYQDGAVKVSGTFDQLMKTAALLKADRFTQHVPMVSVGEVERDPQILEAICEKLAEKLDALPQDVVIGVENMHMVAGEQPDASRRFGYTPQECLRFMEVLAEKTRHWVGINLDLGHARNNAPYSQTYQLSAWYAMVGQHAVGYHIHQVIERGGAFENHTAITQAYGRLISYASFFHCWENGQLRHAPAILEMRPTEAYAQSLAAFRTAYTEGAKAD